jgi:hypothetical protein
MEYNEARKEADRLAKETKATHAVRLSFETGNFFVCRSDDAEARACGSLEYLTEISGIQRPVDRTSN